LIANANACAAAFDAAQVTALAQHSGDQIFLAK